MKTLKTQLDPVTADVKEECKVVTTALRVLRKVTLTLYYVSFPSFGLLFG